MNYDILVMKPSLQKLLGGWRWYLTEEYKTYLHEDAEQGAECFPFECYSLTKYVHPQAVSLKTIDNFTGKM